MRPLEFVVQSRVLLGADWNGAVISETADDGGQTPGALCPTTVQRVPE